MRKARGSDGDRRTARLEVRCTPAMLAFLDEQAQAAGVDRSEWVRRLIQTAAARKG